MPMEDRRRWLRWVGLYLLLMATAIALVLHYVIARAVFWKMQNNLVAAQEEQLLRSHSEYKTIASYQAALGQDVSACTRDLESILAYGHDQARIGAILLSLMETLPAGIGLGTINYDGESRKLAFEAVFPVALKLEEKLTPPKLVTLWEKNPQLSKYVKQFEMENTERILLGGVESMCWRFSAVVGGGGK